MYLNFTSDFKEKAVWVHYQIDNLYQFIIIVIECVNVLNKY